MRHAIPVILLVSLIVVGCTGGGASPSSAAPSPTGSSPIGSAPAKPSPTKPSPSTLDGRTFLSTSVVGHDLVPGSTVRLTFQDERIGINAGCNQMGGSYAVIDGLLTTEQMMTTEMGCEAPLMAQDTWVAGFMSGAAVTLAGDTLTLANGGVTKTLKDREVADPDRPLKGTRWVVDGIIAGDAVSSVPAGLTASVMITDDQLRVQIACSGGVALVQATATTLTIGAIAPTQDGCAPDGSAVQQAVTSVLSGQVAYTIEADVLTITAGPAGLTLRAAD